MGIGIQEWDLGFLFRMLDWNGGLGLGLRIKTVDCGLELRVRIGIGDWSKMERQF